MLFGLFLIGTFWFWILMLAMLVSLTISVSKDSGRAATGTLIVVAMLLLLFGDFNIFAWIFHHPIYFTMTLIGYFIAGVIWMFFKWEVFVRDRNSDVIDAKADFRRRNPVPTLTAENFTLEDFRYENGQKNNPLAKYKDGRAIPLLNKTGEPLTETEIAEHAAKWKAAVQDELTTIYRDWSNKELDVLTRLGLVEPNLDGNHGIKPFVRNHKANCVTWASYWPISMGIFFLHDFVNRIFTTTVDVLHDRLQSRADSVFKNTTVGVTVPVSPVLITPAPEKK